ncbi:DM13 domain-containing protein [Piscinibacter gummiphilus]|uniref:DM13 domain-containing protein n=1 Tax=Piscinibacter gummiphilus TaxID=946333 RepID=A0ABZ0CSL4_9BURK|nr:DM13 domain-containing protein [Piscinibacter gummiphilus]WOB07952.1 DM13 domain-containing protein [Piscinibacter gummiphilus]
MKKALLLTATHLVALAVGFAAGVYLLPILTAAPPSPVTLDAREALFQGQFRRDLKDSDLLHWGEGQVRLDARRIAFDGKLAPGPDYKLYLSPQFVETEADFKRLKPTMLRVGDVRNFERFELPLPPSTDLTRYDTVVIWCETFSQFITAARYR